MSSLYYSTKADQEFMNERGKLYASAEGTSYDDDVNWLKEHGLYIEEQPGVPKQEEQPTNVEQLEVPKQEEQLGETTEPKTPESKRSSLNRIVTGPVYETGKSIADMARGLRVESKHVFKEEFLDKHYNVLKYSITPYEYDTVRDRKKMFISYGVDPDEAEKQAIRYTLKDRISSSKEARDALQAVENAEILKFPEDFGPSPKGILGGIEDITRGIGSSVIPMVGTALSAPIGMGMIHTQIVGASYAENEEAIRTKFPDMSDEEVENLAFKASVTNANWQTPLELIGDIAKIRAVIGKPKFTKLAFKFFEPFVVEGVTEFIQQFPEELTALRALNPDLTPKQFWKHAQDNIIPILKRAGYAGWIGGLTGVVMSGGPRGAAKAVKFGRNLVSSTQQEINALRIKKRSELAKRAEEGKLTTADEELLIKMASRERKGSVDKEITEPELITQINEEEKEAQGIDAQIKEFEEEHGSLRQINKDQTKPVEVKERIERLYKDKENQKNYLDALKTKLEEVTGRAATKRVEQLNKELKKETDNLRNIEKDLKEYQKKHGTIEEIRNNKEKSQLVKNIIEQKNRSKIETEKKVAELNSMIETEQRGITPENIDNLERARLLSEGKEIIAKREEELNTEVNNIKEVTGYREPDVEGKIKEWEAKEIITNAGQRTLFNTEQPSIIHFERIHNEEQIKNVIDLLSKTYEGTIKDAEREAQTHDNTRRLAEEMNMDVNELFSRRANEAYNAEQALAARELLESSGNNIVGLIGQFESIENPVISKSKELEIRLAIKRHAAILAHISGMRAEAGRALQQFRIKTNDNVGIINNIDAELLNEKMTSASIEEIIELVKQADKNDKTERGLSNRKTRENLNKSIKDLESPRWYDYSASIIINGMLSHPKTHLVNMISNLLTSLELVGERAIGARYRQLRNKLDVYRGGPEVSQQGVEVGEAKEMLYAAFRALPDIFKLTSKEFLTRTLLMRESALEEKFGRPQVSKIERNKVKIKPYSFPRNMGNVRDTMSSLLAHHVATWTRNALVQGSMELLRLEDAFANEFNYRMNKHAEAYRIATQEGLTDKALAERIAYIEGHEEEFPSTHLNSDNYAKYATFTNKINNNFILGLQRAFSSGKLLSLFGLFMRTMYNLTRFSIERTPVMNVAASYAETRFLRSFNKTSEGGLWNDLTGRNGNVAQDLAVGKLTMSFVYAAIVAPLVYTGVITGSGPADKEKKKSLMRTGWRPQSIKYGDTYYSYEWLEPFSTILTMTVDAEETVLAADEGVNERYNEDIVNGLFIQLIGDVVHNNFISDFNTFLDFVNNPEQERFSYKLGRTGINMLVPSVLKGLEKKYDPTQREFNSIIESAQANLPSLSKYLPPRRDIWGDEMVLGGGAISDFWLPIYKSEKSKDPINEEIFRLGFTIGMPSKIVRLRGKDVEMTPWEYDTMLQMLKTVKIFRGKTLKEHLNEYIKQDSYKDREDEVKIHILKGFIYDARRQVKDRMRIEMIKSGRAD